MDWNDLLNRVIDAGILIAVLLLAVIGMGFGLAWFAATWVTLFNAFGL